MPLLIGKPWQAADQMHAQNCWQNSCCWHQGELSARSESLLLGELQRLRVSTCRFCHVGHFLGSIQVSSTSPPWTLPPGWFRLALSQMEGTGHFSRTAHHAGQAEDWAPLLSHLAGPSGGNVNIFERRQSLCRQFQASQKPQGLVLAWL